MNTLTVSLTIDMQEMTSTQIDQLVNYWREDVAYNKGRVTEVRMNGPWDEN